MGVLQAIKGGKRKLAVVGLGYVGLPLALAFAAKLPTIGFDNNRQKLALYRKGIDPTEEVGDAAVKNTKLVFTGEAKDLREAAMIIVAVPTPVNGDKTPDLQPVISASRIVGKNISKGTIVCFESTVYPCVTEDICGKIIAEESGLVCGKDFKLAYSPERINPGDKKHRLANIRKIVSGMDAATLKEVEAIYSLIIEAGVFPVSTIKVAEAAKLVENAQRDINIAFMNELSMAFNRMNIDTTEVVAAMNTKWNALGFKPGLVGGHCIGVDPYYFIYEAEKYGYHSQIIAAGRRVNDDMSRYVAQCVVEKLIAGDIKVKGAKVYVFGATFKENCPDVRNSRPLDVCTWLEEYGVEVHLVDPVADVTGLEPKFRKMLVPQNQVKGADALVFAVAHTEFSKYTAKKLQALYKKSDKHKVLIDVKGMFAKKTMEKAGFLYWSL